MAPGEIPQNTALVEATTSSLSELLSQDPEGYSQQDLRAIIGALRAQRERFAAAEASGPKARTPKALKASEPVSRITERTLDELDL